MCGIAAIFSYHPTSPVVSRTELISIRDAMEKRGPDGAGLWLSDNQRVGLAHRRLAILDLTEAGAQPMVTPDGKLQIVFNGEIYNYRELRGQLEARGHRFRSESDTEVLLYAYREYGSSMVTHLRGMFSFALWDDEKQGLFLARDHFGIKPLYYHDDGKAVRVASQVKAILAGGGAHLRAEPAGHVGFLLWGCVPEPYTLYRGLVALPAGHTLWIDASGVRKPRKYFDVAEELASAVGTATTDHAAEILRVALSNSVKQHLIADVPVGVFLSSGIDSATLTALASEQIDQVQAVTLGFGEYFDTVKDEVPLAREIAARYGCDHHVSLISRGDFDEALPSILSAMDQPSIDGVNTYFVARAASRAGLKVALSGVGGDELLGGYPGFRQIPELVHRLKPFGLVPGLGRFVRSISAPVLKRLTSPKYAGLLEYGGTYGGAYLLRRGLFMPWELPEVLDGEIVREGWATLQPIVRLNEWLAPIASARARVGAMELSLYMRNMLLRDADWAGMAHSLEIRTPMVDVDLFRALAPYMSDTTTSLAKRMMRSVPQQPLPDVVLNRPKTGFDVPTREWTQRTVASAGQRGLRGWAAVALSSQPRAPFRADKTRVLVFRVGSLGDTCVAIPAFRLIRQRFREDDIRVLTNFPVDDGVKAAPLQMVLGQSGLVDGYFEYPLGMSSWKAVKRFIIQSRQWRPDILVYLMPVRNYWQLLRDYLFFKYVVRIPRIIGHSFDREARSWVLDGERQLFEKEANRLTRNLGALGVIDLSSKSAWDLALQPDEIASARLALENWPAANNYIVCAIGTKIDTKDWGEDRWQEWAATVSKNNPRLGLVLIGVAIEFERSERVARHWCGPTLNLSGKLRPRQSAAILRQATCFVGHDSGPMHLAAAVGTPCVAIFSAQDKPGIWFPHGDQHKVIYHKTHCFGCRLEVCEKYAKECIRSISVDEVALATKALMPVGGEQIGVQ